MISYLVHYEPNGFIRNCVYEPGEDYIAMCEQRGLAYAVFEGSPPDSIHDTCYFSAGEVKRRLPSPIVSAGEVKQRQPLPATISKLSIAADDADRAVISGLPDPITVKIDGVEHYVGGGVLTITSPMPAVYRVEIDHWPYLPWSAEVVAE